MGECEVKKAWAIIDHKGRVQRLCSEDRVDMVWDFIETLTKRNVIADRPDWYGSMYYWRRWREMRRLGFRVASGVVEMKQEGSFGWPEFKEAA
jgi:hypothetical protein